MCEKCHMIERHRDITGRFDWEVPEGEDPWVECLRPTGHRGPHVGRRFGGQYVAWQTDLCVGECFEECPGCQSEDPEKQCQVYWIVSLEEAQQYINDLALFDELAGDPLI